jgi:hypothetical protein
MDEYERTGQRGRIYVRETAPGHVIVSWYPSQERDPNWPGHIMDTATMSGFPLDAALANDFAKVDERVNAQPWAKPFPARGASVTGDTSNPDDCPICGKYVPSFGSHSVGGQPERQEERCPDCGAKLTRVVGAPWNASAPDGYW